ncbi:MAG: hydantoinase/oxoprolinase family protein [Acidobacteria bacterium]|nr:hydantoinase/oxoprolinase family protein [Acidobacteriota bacterium]
MRIGIDAGGTFTDFVLLHEDGRVEVFKLPSSRQAPHEVIRGGIARARSLGVWRPEVVHGSTVATNALLERKGARTAFVTTAGFEDMLVIARQNRRELYNLMPRQPARLVPEALCFGVRERTLYDGTVHEPLEVAGLRRKLERAGVESVAICLLHSYRNPKHEKALLRELRELGYVCASHEISPEFREYERASTTVVNAYVGPLMNDYLSRLGGLSIMQSNGGFLTAREARKQAVRTILSGPAGGVVGALEMARRSGFTRILGFDMGGTSTDVSLCDGAPRETVEAYVDGLPVRVPMLDIHTVGAGGGSIARVDAGGLLRVGPESAGADPGPACYGRGEECTVTDAQVALGRIKPEQFLSGGMAIHPHRAQEAVERIAKQLGLPWEQAAAGILRVANANMERAIRAVSIERGHDPREYTLVAFGGGGGLHACDLAAGLGMRTVLVPRFAEALSALGMLMADNVRDYATGVLGMSDFEPYFRQLEARAARELRGARLERSADVRYAGQSYELTIPWGGDFHAEHKRVYGYADASRAVEVVTLRVRARKAVVKPEIAPLARERGHCGARRIYLDGRMVDVPLLRRGQVGGKLRRGPFLVLDYGTTILVPASWSALVDRTGNLVIHRA